MTISESFWEGKRVFLTGHTGFKGSWLCLWLQSLGANVSGYALAPLTNPSLYNLAKVDDLIESTIADVRDEGALRSAMQNMNPDIVIHMAAQPLVCESYRNPVETFDVNIMGTVHLLEAVRQCDSVKAVVNVTTDKCYENREWHWGYRENDAMGGYDPYSSSKGCSELVTAAFRNSYFNPTDYASHRVAVGSARAGNVIGGGDWGEGRLISDCIRALLKEEEIRIRNPIAIRPWQHVLEPISGYLVLAERLFKEGASFAQGWNFGPNDSDAKSVEWVVRELCNIWGNNASYCIDISEHPHEATYLKLDCSKAIAQLGWKPRWNISEAIAKVVDWTFCYRSSGDLRTMCLQQIAEFQSAESNL